MSKFSHITEEKIFNAMIKHDCMSDDERRFYGGDVYFTGRGADGNKGYLVLGNNGRLYPEKRLIRIADGRTVENGQKNGFDFNAVEARNHLEKLGFTIFACKKDGSNNIYHYFPNDEDKFKKQALKDERIVLIGFDAEGVEIYNHSRKVATYWSQTVKNNLETMYDGDTKIKDRFNSCNFYAVPKSMEYIFDNLRNKEAAVTILGNNSIKETIGEEREGEFVERKILSRKRNQEIVKQVKARDNYTCKCKMCNFNYNNKIVQAHHLTPLSEADGEIVVKPDDLITLCPNCHAIAHLLLKEDPKYQDKDNLLGKLWSLKLTT